MFDVAELIQATGGRLAQGQGKSKAAQVSIDSRRVKKGDVFIAVKGDVFDGHDFINDVVARGVRVIVAHKPVQITDPKVDLILVKDTVRALGHVARFHRLRFKVPVIALTGSAGKTTTKEMLAAVLGRKFNVLKNIGTENNHIGVPLTLLKLRAFHKIVVLECGTNQPGDIAWLADVARPDVAVFTNIGESHLEKLKTPLGVLREKWNLTRFIGKQGTVVLNADDPLLMTHAKDKLFKIVSVGIDHKASFQAKAITIVKGRYISFKIGKENIELRSCGVNNIYNALSVIAVGSRFKVPMGSMVKALKDFEFPKGRGRIVPLGSGFLVDDTYNANPVSMRSALQTLDALSVQGKKIFVAADMLELGSREVALHRALGKAVAGSCVDVLITVGKLAKSIASEAKRLKKALPVFPCADLEEAKRAMQKSLRNGDAVLIKGSRRMKMEGMVEYLLASPN